MLNEYFPKLKINECFPKLKIEEKEVIRKCQICGKEYKDTKIVINGIPSYSFAICPDCILHIPEKIYEYKKSNGIRNGCNDSWS